MNLTKCTDQIIGRINSVETLGCVDGPGLRMVIFMQGCHLRCVYCHNPETWDMGGGMQMDTEELLRKVLRFRSYFGKNGGVTLSGGEPLLQPEFALGLFKKLRSEGISTAIDTAGVLLTDTIAEVLSNTDVVLLDIKMPDEERYRDLTGGSLETALRFLAAASRAGCRIWIRHVVVPGINDKIEDMKKLRELIKNNSANVELIELLPYHSMGKEKYSRLGIPYKLDGWPETGAERLAELNKELFTNFFNNLSAVQQRNKRTT